MNYPTCKAPGVCICEPDACCTALSPIVPATLVADNASRLSAANVASANGIQAGAFLVGPSRVALEIDEAATENVDEVWASISPAPFRTEDHNGKTLSVGDGVKLIRGHTILLVMAVVKYKGMRDRVVLAPHSLAYCVLANAEDCMKL